MIANAHEGFSIHNEFVVGQKQEHLCKRNTLSGMMRHVSLVVQTAVQSLLFLDSSVVDPVESVLQFGEINALNDMRRAPIHVARCHSCLQVAQVVPERVDPNFEYPTQFLIPERSDRRRGSVGGIPQRKARNGSSRGVESWSLRTWPMLS